eukprot:1360289-Amorphochlora_amoeboformis.AAC.1
MKITQELKDKTASDNQLLTKISQELKDKTAAYNAARSQLESDAKSFSKTTDELRDKTAVCNDAQLRLEKLELDNKLLAATIRDLNEKTAVNNNEQVRVEKLKLLSKTTQELRMVKIRNQKLSREKAGSEKRIALLETEIDNSKVCLCGVSKAWKREKEHKERLEGVNIFLRAERDRWRSICKSGKNAEKEAPVPTADKKRGHDDAYVKQEERLPLNWMSERSKCEVTEVSFRSERYRWAGALSIVVCLVLILMPDDEVMLM